MRHEDLPDYNAEREFRLWGRCGPCQDAQFPTLVTLRTADLPDPPSLIDEAEFPELRPAAAVPVAFGTEERGTAAEKTAVVTESARTRSYYAMSFSTNRYCSFGI